VPRTPHRSGNESKNTTRALAPQGSPIAALAVDAADVPDADVEITNVFGVLLAQ
jgi:hypothetical protein